MARHCGSGFPFGKANPFDSYHSIIELMWACHGRVESAHWNRCRLAARGAGGGALALAGCGGGADPPPMEVIPAAFAGAIAFAFAR